MARNEKVEQNQEQPSEIKQTQLTNEIEKGFEIESEKVVDVDPKDEKKSNRFMIIMVSVTLSVVTLASLIYSLIRVLQH